MPIYEYTCAKCGQTFEIKASMSEKAKGLKTTCPACGGTKANQVLSCIAVGTSSSSSSGGAKPARSGGCGPGCGCHH